MAMFRAFRAGLIRPIYNHLNAEVQAISEAFDDLKPDSRQGRIGAVFASPDIQSVARWMSSRTPGLREIRISDTEGIYAYPVQLWENAFLGWNRSPSHDSVRDYWAAGVPIGDILDDSFYLNSERGEWEILIPEERISSAVPISTKRILEACELRDHTRLHAMLNHGVYFRGTCNRCREAESDDS